MTVFVNDDASYTLPGTLPELKEYLGNSHGNDTNIYHPAINVAGIETYTPGRRMGLQIADAVASSFFYGVESSQYGFIEDRYARMLKPVMYQHDGEFAGYGVTFWPRETEDLIAAQEELQWVTGTYQ